jgi:hypothetical protein
MVEQDLKADLQEQLDEFSDNIDVLQAMFHSTLESYFVSGKIKNYYYGKDMFFKHLWRFEISTPQDPNFVICFSLSPHNYSYFSLHKKHMVLR